ncbi:MAG: ferrochelatase [Parachlamydiaceae bacterium]|nr:ferrochelatase [Parachlamydiaceae bacterium]
MVTANIGILLVNLGTPNSPRPFDVFNYLNEFLTDERVIDFGWLKRQLFVRGVIVPFRFRQSAKLYESIWTEKGSPLLLHGIDVRNKLQEELGDEYFVSLGMRYQNPSIKSCLDELKMKHLKEIIIIPMFPQYSSATTGSVNAKIMEEIKYWEVIPKLTFINNFADHPGFINALCERARQYDIGSYDHILFSYHGLPERQIRKADKENKCLSRSCCKSLSEQNQHCYKGQCYATTRRLVEKLGLSENQYSVCFQSRLGRDPWIQPYTSDVIKNCSEKGWKNLLVFSPSFVADCLETISEIGHEYNVEFQKLGGERLQLVEGLNSHPKWIEGLKQIIVENSVMTSNKV